MVRSADFVETMTPTLDGTILLDGSIKPGSTLEERLTTPPADFQSIPSAGGGSTILVNNATAQVTPQDPLQLPSISAESLGFAAMHFLHGTHFLHKLQSGVRKRRAASWGEAEDKVLTEEGGDICNVSGAGLLKLTLGERTKSLLGTRHMQGRRCNCAAAAK